jgi:hypothetical protein
MSVHVTRILERPALLSHASHDDERHHRRPNHHAPPQALRSAADEGGASVAAADVREKGLRARLTGLQQQLEEREAELERLQVFNAR